MRPKSFLCSSFCSFNFVKKKEKRKSVTLHYCTISFLDENKEIKFHPFQKFERKKQSETIILFLSRFSASSIAQEKKKKTRRHNIYIACLYKPFRSLQYLYLIISYLLIQGIYRYYLVFYRFTNNNNNNNCTAKLISISSRFAEYTIKRIGKITRNCNENVNLKEIR